ncbi:Hypothetical predicted protein [Cloeon dipterum]|uniref:Uncharacterized protein n=1 Tax=Cloeon dipterum TaxID=197152 RepID=A0A8S1DVZ3_9INSE|nr:Hypothetical predicted protein [Cloeon dipterum]
MDVEEVEQTPLTSRTAGDGSQSQGVLVLIHHNKHLLDELFNKVDSLMEMMASNKQAGIYASPVVQVKFCEERNIEPLVMKEMRRIISNLSARISEVRCPWLTIGYKKIRQMKEGADDDDDEDGQQLGNVEHQAVDGNIEQDEDKESYPLSEDRPEEEVEEEEEVEANIDEENEQETDFDVFDLFALCLTVAYYLVGPGDP